MPLHVSSHPVVLDCLAGLRDRRTDPEEFRGVARKIVTLLLYEATQRLPVRAATVSTPMTEAPASYVDVEVVAIPVLRAGLGLLPPVLDLLPRVNVGYLGLERDEETAVARIYTARCRRSPAGCRCSSIPCSPRAARRPRRST